VVEPPRSVAVGEITGAHGVAGAVWVRPLGGGPGRAGRLRRVQLARDGERVVARVVSARELDGRWLIALDVVRTREAAEALRGWRLEILESERPALPPDTFYVSELVGREVVTEEGEILGRLRDALSTGGNDVLVIDGPRGEVLFPALKSLVVSCPPGAGAITVRVPPGLLEACTSGGGP
jgi:16S rRNA processing protein RimM